MKAAMKAAMKDDDAQQMPSQPAAGTHPAQRAVWDKRVVWVGLLALLLTACGISDDERALIGHWRVVDDVYELPASHLPEHDEIDLVTQAFMAQLTADGQLILRQDYSYVFIAGPDTSEGEWTYDNGQLILDEPYGERLLFDIINIDATKLNLHLHQRRGGIPFEIYISLITADSAANYTPKPKPKPAAKPKAPPADSGKGPALVPATKPAAKPAPVAPVPLDTAVKIPLVVD